MNTDKISPHTEHFGKMGDSTELIWLLIVFFL